MHTVRTLQLHWELYVSDERFDVYVYMRNFVDNRIMLQIQANIVWLVCALVLCEPCFYRALNGPDFFLPNTGQTEL